MGDPTYSRFVTWCASNECYSLFLQVTGAFISLPHFATAMNSQKRSPHRKKVMGSVSDDQLIIDSWVSKTRSLPLCVLQHFSKSGERRPSKGPTFLIDGKETQIRKIQELLTCQSIFVDARFPLTTVNQTVQLYLDTSADLTKRFHSQQRNQLMAPVQSKRWSDSGKEQ